MQTKVEPTASVTSNDHPQQHQSTNDPRPISFAAGPSMLPPPVLTALSQAVLSGHGFMNGQSILEISHRSPYFSAILSNCKNLLAQLCDVSLNDWDILFLPGGATQQFSAIPLTFGMAVTNNNDSQNNPTIPSAHYCVTGQWSQRAADEAIRMGLSVFKHLSDKTKNSQLVQPTMQSTDNASECNSSKQFQQKNSISYVYFCDNETVDGIEYHSYDWLASIKGLKTNATKESSAQSMVADYGNAQLTATDGQPNEPKDDNKTRAQTITDIPSNVNAPLIICDASSSFLSKQLPMQWLDVVFAGAQKNIGPAGVTIVMIRKSALALAKSKQNKNIPLMMDLPLMAEHDSLYNTPPVFAIYGVQLMLEYLVKTFGKHQETSTDEHFSRELHSEYSSHSSNEHSNQSITVDISQSLNELSNEHNTEDNSKASGLHSNINSESFAPLKNEVNCLMAIAKNTQTKAKMLYDCLDRNADQVEAIVWDSNARSNVNVVFRFRPYLLPDGKQCTATEAENQFLKDAASQRGPNAPPLIDLRGHRSVGGLRASLYNGISVKQTAELVCFLDGWCHSRRVNTC